MITNLIITNRKEQKIKEILSAAYEPPEPRHKKEFVKKYSFNKISSFSFILSQVRFIRKWVWAVSVVLFAVLAASCDFLTRKETSVWLASGLIPFIAVTAFAESTKSIAYEMDELEKAARFSLKSIMLARMEIIGFFHLIMFFVLSVIVRGYTQINFIKNGIYLLVPYLFTTYICMLFVRGNPRGAELIQICTKAAVLISAVVLIAERYINFLYLEQYFIWWIAVFFLLLAAIVMEYRRLFAESGAADSKGIAVI